MYPRTPIVRHVLLLGQTLEHALVVLEVIIYGRDVKEGLLLLVVVVMMVLLHGVPSRVSLRRPMTTLCARHVPRSVGKVTLHIDDHVKGLQDAPRVRIFFFCSVGSRLLLWPWQLNPTHRTPTTLLEPLLHAMHVS